MRHVGEFGSAVGLQPKTQNSLSVLFEQVPVLAKADSMTTDELREFRGHVRSQLEHVRAHISTVCICCFGTQKRRPA